MGMITPSTAILLTRAPGHELHRVRWLTARLRHGAAAGGGHDGDSLASEPGAAVHSGGGWSGRRGGNSSGPSGRTSGTAKRTASLHR